MLTIKPCKLIDLKPAIAYAFETDYEGLKNYYDPVNTQPVTTIAQGVNETMLKLFDFEISHKKLVNYQVWYKNNCIGFFCYFFDSVAQMNCLVSFGINKHYRLPVFFAFILPSNKKHIK